MFANNKRIIPNPENGAKVKLSTHLYSYSMQVYLKAILRESQNTKLCRYVDLCNCTDNKRRGKNLGYRTARSLWYVHEICHQTVCDYYLLLRGGKAGNLVGEGI